VKDFVGDNLPPHEIDSLYSKGKPDHNKNIQIPDPEKKYLMVKGGWVLRNRG